MTKMDELSQVHDKLPEGEVVLDVRTKEEFNAGHVPGALNIPHEEVANHLDELRGYKVVHIHCKSGKRAGVAMQILRDHGLDNLHCITDSGMDHWVDQGYPTHKP